MGVLANLIGVSWVVKLPGPRVTESKFTTEHHDEKSPSKATVTDGDTRGLTSLDSAAS